MTACNGDKVIDRHHLPQIQIRIDEANPMLYSWLTSNSAKTWVVLTAWNPNGDSSLTVEENQKRQERLLREIQERNLVAIPMWGLGDQANWAAEPSLLIFNVCFDDVESWLQKYQQNACVFGEVDEDKKISVPQLILRGDVKFSSDTIGHYRQTTYQSAPLLLHHPHLCQLWLRACQAHRVSIGSKIEMNDDQNPDESKIRLRIPFGGPLFLSFWSH